MNPPPMRVLCLTLIIALNGCEDRNSPAARASNENYLKNTLGQIVIENRDSSGEVSESFDQALGKSGVTLRNRGDYYGCAIVYRKTGPDAFYFHSYGPNGTDDAGAGDDIKVSYSNGRWVKSRP